MRVAEVVRLRRTHGPFKDGPNSHEFGYKNPTRRCPLGLYGDTVSEPWAIESRPVGQRREGFRHGEMRVAEVLRLRRTHGPFKDGPNSHEFGYKNPSRRC